MSDLRKNHAIGVFDSGVGGLTVYDALRRRLPRENFVYLGDTARLPYGTKGPETVAQYALQAARLLMEHDIKLLVVACNTASALALPHLQTALPHLPCIGVIEPGAEAACQTSAKNKVGGGKIAVLATESTVRSGAYAAAIHRRCPAAIVQMLACNLLVGMAEEGWCEGLEAEAVIDRYLRELGGDFDTLVLGCTHFPLLAATIRQRIGPTPTLIDSAVTTAETVAATLQKQNLQHSQTTMGTSRFLVTDSPERFERLAQRFLKASITAEATGLDLKATTKDDGKVLPFSATLRGA